VRIISEHGLCDLTEWPETSDDISLVFQNKREKTLVSKRDIFPLTNYGVIRIVEIFNGGHIYFISNLLFYQSLEEANEVFYEPIPLNENRILLNIKRMDFQSNRELFVEDNYLWLQVWIDRWGVGETVGKKNPTLKRFDEWVRNTPGTIMGILSSVLLDVSLKRIMRFCISVPRGVVYEITSET